MRFARYRFARDTSSDGRSMDWGFGRGNGIVADGIRKTQSGCWCCVLVGATAAGRVFFPSELGSRGSRDIEIRLSEPLRIRRGMQVPADLYFQYSRLPIDGREQIALGP